MQLTIESVEKLLQIALSEDYGIGGDITSQYTIDKNKEVSFKINAREDLILCGSDIANYFIKKHSSIKSKNYYMDAETVRKGEVIISGQGFAHEVMLLERVILNFLQHLSGVSTVTGKYVEQTQKTKAKIFDTRKTTPGLRSLQKYAVRCGGGHNHRLALDSGVMIKDNHIAICGSITKAVTKARSCKPHYLTIEVECDSLEQVKEAVECKVDIIMLDNMTLKQMSEAVLLINNTAIVEASGNVSLNNVKDIAKTGVDVISVGKITHSAPSVDIGLDIL
ncbi:MAG: hypothetical protein DGJ47_000099 [Rickettsiaceae bacterium]